MLEFRILGPLEVVSDGSPVPLGGPKQRATLAILLLRANRVVSIDRLADELYGGAPPVTAVTQVQRQISELRKALGAESAIETRAPGYLIHVAPGCLDLARFEQQTGDAANALARGDAHEASDLLRNALICGGARRSPISRTSPSRRSRSDASRRSGWRRSSSGSRPTLPSAATAS